MSTLAHLGAGDGPRPVVLLHGFLGSARNLATLARGLAQHEPSLRVVALDLTGHGASPPLPPGADLGTLAHDVLETAGALGLPPPLTVIGHSLGGRVGLRACLVDPGMIRAVTLLDISPSVHQEGERQTEGIMDAVLDAPAEAPQRDVFRRHLRAAGLADSLVAWLLTNVIWENGAYRWRFERAALAALRERTGVEDLWAAVEGPRSWRVRCLRGAHSPYVPAVDAQRLERAGCPVDVVEGAGHFLHVDRPAEVLALCLRELRATPAP
jgi:esterase